MNLKHLKSRNRALPDLMNYATLVEPGVVLGKDGSLMAGWYFRGQDLTAQTNVELNALNTRLNDKFKRLGDGWTLHVDAIRRSTASYPSPEMAHFPDPVSQRIDSERRSQFERDGDHFETIHAMVLHYLPPAVAQSHLEQMMYSRDTQRNDGDSIATRVLSDFRGWVVEFAESLSDIAEITPMTGYTVPAETGEDAIRDDLVEFLGMCIIGRYYPVNLCREAPFLDAVLGCHDFTGGLEPKIDNRHLRTVAITGYPLSTHPGILSTLENLETEYRWSNRFIYLDHETAKKELNRYRRQWQQKQRGFTDQFLGTRKGATDRDAVSMVDETEMALADVSSLETTFGYFTNVIVLTSESLGRIEEDAKYLITTIRNLGFGARLETVNSIEAWLGSLPGHSYTNIRRPLVNTMNLSDLLPLSSIWTGNRHNPCDRYPPGSPALIYADAAGATPFRLNLHVGDVGHTLIIGPTGTGKSTLLAMIAAQFRKYRNAKVFCFDKGYSIYCLTEAVGGAHYDVGDRDSSLTFCPLAESDITWAEGWVRDCCELQLGSPLTPEQTKQLHATMGHLAHSKEKSLTALHTQLQNQVLRDALAHYTLHGNAGHLLDGEADNLAFSDFTCFELEALWPYADSEKLPVLSYLFHRIERQLTGSPAVIILDEAWVMLGHPIFRAKIVEWLKVLRKANCAVVMATQSLTDAIHSGILDVIIESTATRIFLPNTAANSEVSRPIYQMIGLNQVQIDLISRAVPKRQYYAMSAEGNRLFDLALGPVALSFAAQSGAHVKKEVQLMKHKYGAQWIDYWSTNRAGNGHD